VAASGVAERILRLTKSTVTIHDEPGVGLDPQGQLELEAPVGIVERSAEQLAQPCRPGADALWVDPQ
jgi:hypothetical protein